MPIQSLMPKAASTEAVTKCIPSASLVDFLISNLGSNARKSRDNVEIEIAKLRKSKFLEFGKIGLVLQEKLEGDLDKWNDYAFANAILGGRDDAIQLYRMHQMNYDSRKPVLPEETTNFIYEHYGKAAPNLHFLAHIVYAFNREEFRNLKINLLSPPRPEKSALPLVVSSSHSTKYYYGKQVPLGNDLCTYLARVLLFLDREHLPKTLPIVWAQQRALHKQFSDYVNLVQ